MAKRGSTVPTCRSRSRALQEEHAVNYLVRAIMAAPEGSLTVCTLGPMTNLAMAMTMEPRIVPRIREVVLMGGGFFEGGNATPAAEFNIFVDPHAAHKVFESGVPVTMAPIDCTYTAQMTPEWLDALRATGSHAAIEAANLADFYRQYGAHKFPTAARPIHDACVTGYLLAPEIYEQRSCSVTVDIVSPETIGMTVVDWWHVTGSAQELQRATTDRSAAFLRPDARADQLPALTAEGGKNNRSQWFRTG